VKKKVTEYVTNVFNRSHSSSSPSFLLQSKAQEIEVELWSNWKTGRTRKLVERNKNSMTPSLQIRKVIKILPKTKIYAYFCRFLALSLKADVIFLFNYYYICNQ
jgi:hypothetical protein